MRAYYRTPFTTVDSVEEEVIVPREWEDEKP